MRLGLIALGGFIASWALVAVVVIAASMVAGSPAASPLAAQGGGERGPSPCVLHTEKTASPRRLQLGERTKITLRARPTCPVRSVPLEVVLVIDNSGSMASDGKLTTAKRAARTFIDRTDLDRTRIGIVTFNTVANVELALSADANALARAVDAIGPLGSTNIVAALDLAGAVLADGRANRPWSDRDAAIEVVVILSDGRHTAGSNDPDDDGRGVSLEAAERLRAEGVILATVCLGSDCDRLLMSLSASSRALYFDSPTGAELVDVYELIAQSLRQPTVSFALVEDIIPDNMRIITTSAEPVPDAIDGQTLIWRLEDVAPEGFEISYFVQPLELGEWPTNVVASADFRDIFERVGRALFPVPTVNVSYMAFLPLALRERCDPKLRNVDVVLLIDVSSSMAAPARAGDISKRDAAARAATTFVDRLRLNDGSGAATTGDRVAVLAFDDGVRTLTGLSANAATVRAALAALPAGEGTRIDTGLIAATELLYASGSTGERTRAIVLLTDGRPSTGDDVVLGAAARATREGATIFTVGFGDDVNPALLRAIAGDASRYGEAGDAADLEALYSELAVAVPCPIGRHDWSLPWP